MNSSNEIINGLIVKQIEGSIKTEELSVLDKWINNSPENKEYYDEILRADALSRTLFKNSVDTDKAWQNVKTRLTKVKSENRSRPLFFQTYWKYAAVLFLVVVAFFFIERTSVEEPILVESGSEQLKQVLFDGSKVVLNNQSALSQIQSGKRSYILSGSGTFEVAHNDQDPFELLIDDIRIKDLGTVFQVNAYPSSDTVHVKVTEGVVQFYTESNSGLLLNEGEEGIFIKSLNRFYKRSIDQTRAFLTQSFESTLLRDVLEYISYSFRKEIVVENNDILNCLISVDFAQAPFSVVKEIIEETLGLTISETDSELIIGGNGCN